MTEKVALVFSLDFTAGLPDKAHAQQWAVAITGLNLPSIALTTVAASTGHNLACEVGEVQEVKVVVG